MKADKSQEVMGEGREEKEEKGEEEEETYLPSGKIKLILAEFIMN